MKYLIKTYNGKTLNKRISIKVLYDDVEDNHSFLVETRTLFDFSKRIILETKNIYSYETFAILKDLFSVVLEEGKNKMFLLDGKNKNKLKMLVTENGHPKFDRKNEQQ